MKRLISVVMAVLLVSINASAASFLDVPESHWAHAIINELADSGVINGVTNETYEPESPLTRAQFVKLIVCALEDYDSSVAYAPVFSDTTADDWYTPYVACGVQSGVITRDTDLFRPDEPITRGEAAIWMINGMGVSSDATCPFSDVTDAKQKVAVGTAAEYGLINGYEDGTFKPDNTLTRAEAAALISRMMQKTKSFHAIREDSANEIVFKDNVKYVESGEKNAISNIDSSKKTVTLSNADAVVKALRKGDILYIPACNNLPEGLIAKITNVKKSGNNVTVTCAQPELDEFVESIDISTVVTASPEHFKAGNGLVTAGAPNLGNTGKVESDFDTVINGGVAGDFKGGKLRWKATGTAIETGTIHYETENYATKDGAYASLDMELKVLVDVYLAGKNLKAEQVLAHASAVTDTTAVFGYSKSASAEQVFKLPECEIPVAGPVKVGLTLYAVMRAEGEFTVEAIADIRTDAGMRYYNGEFETWNDPLVTPTVKADADGSLEIGPGVEATVKIDCGSDFFLGDIGLVELGAEVGTGINGQVDVEQSVSVGLDGVEYTGNQMKPDENGVIHDCYACFFGDIYLYSQFSAGLADELNEWVKEDFDIDATVKSPKYTAVVNPWHFSVGGTEWKGPEFELNACDHKLYQTDFTVINSKTKEPVSGVTLYISDKPEVTVDESGKYRTHLKPDAYVLKATADGYQDYQGIFYVLRDKNVVEVAMEEETVDTVYSSNIAYYNGVTNVLGKVPGLTNFSFKPAKYDYVCGIAFYKNRLYYSCKEAGTSDYYSAIYSCNPDGSDLRLIAEGPWITGEATHFMITGDKVYYGGSHRGSGLKYYDLQTGQTCNTGLTKNDYLIYANGDYIYYATYSKASKSYRIYQKSMKTGEVKQITSCKSIYDYNILPGENGEVYYVTGKKVVRYNGDNSEVILNSDTSISNIHAITGDLLYYSYYSGNYGYLSRYNMATGAVELLDYHRTAGGGDPYFNW